MPITTACNFHNTWSIEVKGEDNKGSSQAIRYREDGSKKAHGRGEGGDGRRRVIKETIEL